MFSGQLSFNKKVYFRGKQIWVYFHAHQKVSLLFSNLKIAKIVKIYAEIIFWIEYCTRIKYLMNFSFKNTLIYIVYMYINFFIF